MLTNTVKIRVPATSANCGPGFDTLGVACGLYNVLEFALDTEKKFSIETTGEGAADCPQDDTNLVWQAAKSLLEKVDMADKYRGCSFKMHNEVPVTRGLGSSSAAIVAGLTAANVLLGTPLSRHDMLQLATKIEGHPDNVAPALYGGFTINVMANGDVQCYSFLPKLNFKLVVAIPAFELSTAKARAVMPKEVPISDAVSNISRAAMMAVALTHGRENLLPFVFEDKLHQPYRACLIPGMNEVFEAAKAAGATGSFLSGAGPCLMSFVLTRHAEPSRVGHAMVQEFKKHGVEAEAKVLSMDISGAQVVF